VWDVIGADDTEDDDEKGNREGGHEERDRLMKIVSVT